jgi:hypothetical protein
MSSARRVTPDEFVKKITQNVAQPIFFGQKSSPKFGLLLCHFQIDIPK